MDETRLGRRERRRRKIETKMEGVHKPVEGEFQKPLENLELPSKPHVTQSSGRLTRRDTYTVLRSKSDFAVGKTKEPEEDFNGRSEGSGNSSAESRNLTYSLNKDSDSSNHHTYNIDRPPGSDAVRPVPAPRKRKSAHLEPERVSSDTDRDITEIDLDDLRVKSPNSDPSPKPSPASDKSENREPTLDQGKSDSVPPVPKPRKTVKNAPRPPEPESDSDKSKNEPPPKTVAEDGESVKSETKESPKNGEDPSEQPHSNELPLVSSLEEEAKSDEVKRKTKKQRKLIGDLLDRKGGKKKSKILMKLEKKKIPKISTILKDLKEEESKDAKTETEEEKTDLQIDSPRYKESAQNGQIYVQSKNGFHVMERDEVLRKGSDKMEQDGNGGTMEDSNVKTAVAFQKFWSRAMTCVHGVLAGIGFSHAATITAIMLHHNYHPQGFITVYSFLSLKIHYVFYMLTALCIVSSFDRVDIGHLNRRHWDNAWKSPSAWVVLTLYVISFVLTFANHQSEAKFDALPDGNETDIWSGHTQSEIQVGLLQWYHAVWARDVLVLFAWLVIALTKFEDFLHSHISNMAKYANVKEEKCLRHKTDYF